MRTLAAFVTALVFAAQTVPGSAEAPRKPRANEIAISREYSGKWDVSFFADNQSDRLLCVLAFGHNTGKIGGLWQSDLQVLLPFERHKSVTTFHAFSAVGEGATDWAADIRLMVWAVPGVDERLSMQEMKRWGSEDLARLRHACAEPISRDPVLKETLERKAWQ